MKRIADVVSVLAVAPQRGANRLHCSLYVALVSLLLAIPCVEAADWKKELDHKLDEEYSLTKLSLSWKRVTRPGGVYIIQQEGILGQMDRAGSLTKIYVEDGQLRQASGFFASGLMERKHGRLFEVNEPVYIRDIKVGNREVQVFIHARNIVHVNVDGSSEQTRYKSLVAFRFPKNYLPDAPYEAIKAAIDTVLLPESEAAARETKTISLGQTPETVERIVGRPNKVINLGEKLIYIYDDIKVTFVEGKITDVN